MSILDLLQRQFVFLDGGMGTLLQARGLKPGEAPEGWSITHPDAITAIHRAYYDAGSNLVLTNTFGVNSLRYSADEIEKLVRASVDCARRALEESTGTQERYIALDIGPTGQLLKPFGPLDFEDAVKAFSATVRAGVQAGVDCVCVETMNDCYETKAAVLAVKENSDLPLFVSNAYGSDGKLMTGTPPEAMVAMLEGLGADAVGVNCSFGPKALAEVVRRYLAAASVPVFFKPNAGMPREQNGKTVYDVLPDEFAREVAALVPMGLRMAGGCCGTTPEYLKALVKEASPLPMVRLPERHTTAVTSRGRRVELGQTPVLIGERINPTGKKRFREALTNGDIAYVLSEGLDQEERGVHLLDVNVGVPGLDEKSLLPHVVEELQAVTDLPLQLDTANPEAMANAMRIYNGKAMINSVNGREDVMSAIFPLVKKYGGVVVALTLDENGIPPTAEGRLAIAERILRRAEEFGLKKQDIVFDTLTMAVSADPNAAKITLQALRMIREKTGCATVLGVSNVSFGLPAREVIGAVFLTLALQAGLSAAIMNPKSASMMGAYRSYLTLTGQDSACMDYISFASQLSTTTVSASPAEKNAEPATGDGLHRAVTHGLCREAAQSCAAQLANGHDPMALVQEVLLPALEEVGKGFEEKRVFLPQLMMSAEAAEAAFGEIRNFFGGQSPAARREDFVLATVEGDVHDIGKNIVKLLLENYGYAVHDLGRDVPPQRILEEVTRLHAPLCGLSALMTTTVPAMAETIRLIHEKAPWCRVIVGGAVLTERYAAEIHADGYAKDAMAAVRCAERLTGRN